MRRTASVTAACQSVHRQRALGVGDAARRLGHGAGGRARRRSRRPRVAPRAGRRDDREPGDAVAPTDDDRRDDHDGRARAAGRTRTTRTRTGPVPGRSTSSSTSASASQPAHQRWARLKRSAPPTSTRAASPQPTRPVSTPVVVRGHPGGRRGTAGQQGEQRPLGQVARGARPCAPSPEARAAATGAVDTCPG